MAAKTSANIVDLSRSLQQKESEMELLQQTFTEIGSELDITRVFQIVSERALALINAETLLIPLLDDNCETYTYRGGAGKNADEIVGESLPLDYGVCGWVWKQKKPWWQGMLDELGDDEKNLWEQQAGNMILVPLQGKRDFLGGIAGLNKKGGGNFDKKDLNLLQLFASIVSVAIENAMAVKSIKDSHELNVNYRYKLEHLNKQLIESSKELEYLSLYDSVTSLPNRSLFHDRLTRDIAEAECSDTGIGILLIDIDSFKDINDTLGHDHGDSLLNKIARRFAVEIKSNETLARLGGDEFCIVLDELPDSIYAEAIAERIINAVSRPYTLGQETVKVGISVGIALLSEEADNDTRLMKLADEAMYRAKNSGKGQWSY
ncbi:MAG: diguanylate cyclase [Gammaproteobacteria bacterium]|nr:diguanylate cyclase [Gammaproteobacteria bacterium]